MTPPIRMVSVPADGEGRSPIYAAAYESIRKGAPGLSDATCQVIARSINMKLTAAPVREEGGAVLSVDDVPVWADGIVTDGERVAMAQKAEADHGGTYWAVDGGDGGLDWEPTHFISLTTLATREEAPAEAGGLEWKVDYNAVVAVSAYLQKQGLLDSAKAVERMLSRAAAYRNCRDAHAELAALRAQPQARKDAQPVAWQLLAQQQPKPGHKIITLHDDGSGAALLFVHDGGVIDSDGDDYDTIGSPQTWWAYLPDDFEFWCEGLPEEPVTLPAHRVPDHPATDALRVAVEALAELSNVGMVGRARQIAKEALAALQAGQKGGAA